MKRFIQVAVLVLMIINFTSCIGCSDNSGKYDDEYWRSVNREHQLKDAGLDGAANMERNARLDRLDGGGYQKADGSGTQVHYKGSKQQQDDLKAIDEYIRTHPND